MIPKWIRFALPALIALTMSFGVASIAMADDHPIAVDDGPVTVDEDGFVDIDVVANDDPTDSEIDSFTQGLNGTVEQIEDGTLRYTPDANYNGPDSFQYTLDDAAEDGSGTATVTIEVTADVPPIAADDEALTDEDVAVIIDVLANDTEGDSGVESFTEPSNGTVELNEDGTLTYTPDADFNGVDSFDYTLEDDEDLTGTATVNVTIDPVGDAPVAVDDSTSTAEVTPVLIDVLANDSDPDGIDGALDPAATVALMIPAEHGLATVDGVTQEVTYTPDLGFTGIDSFTYMIEHGVDTSNEAIVTVFVGPHADLSIVKEVEIDEGDATLATFVITVSNAGPDAATEVVVTDAIPVGITYVSDENGGSYDSDTRVWTWTAAGLAVDGSVELRIHVTLVDPEAEVTNTVTVSSDVPDQNSDNDQDSLTLNPIDGPDFDACTGASHPSFAVICELLQDEELSDAVRLVLEDLLYKMAGKTASGWYRNHGGGEDSKLAAFCERKPDHKRCLEFLDADGDEDEDEGNGKGKGKNKGKGPGGDEDDD